MRKSLSRLRAGASLLVLAGTARAGVLDSALPKGKQK